MTTGPAPICTACVRFDPTGPNGWVCEAFPDGIPDAITEEGFDHRNPFDGDRGVRFQLEEGAESRLASYEADAAL